MSVTRYQFKVGGRQFVLAADHDEEVSRLKKQVDRLTFDPMSCWDEHGEWMPMHTHFAAVEHIKAENARLKAEVERLTVLKDAYKRMIKRRDKWVYEHRSVRKQLEAEVERLTKAGDAMAKLMFIDKDYIGSPKQEAVVEWCKSTEGKQP